MEQIPLRQFQLKASEYLKKLPIALTRYNKVVACVVESIGIKPEIVDTSVSNEEKSVDNPWVSTTRKGFCGRHFERGIEYPLQEVAYQDINGIVGDYKWTCPSCIKSLEEEVKRNGGHIIIKNE